MTKEKLQKFCEEKKIFFPKNATKEYLHSAIVRASLHQAKINPKECFGFWEFENTACVTCDFEGKCFTISIGMGKKEFFSALERAENPKIRFSGKSRRKS